jgi:flavodoxin I
LEIAHTNNIALTPKKIAACGIGNSLGYTNNFMDALGILEEKISEVGYWSTNDYDFNESKAVRDDKFVGFALDNN